MSSMSVSYILTDRQSIHVCYACFMKLICPVCREELKREGRAARCSNGHSYDYAKSGYLNLYLSHKTVHGDDADMVKARTAFLNTGAYAFLRSELRSIFEAHGSTSLVDLGCGEGYYTSYMPQSDRAAFDLARKALMHAAKNDPDTQYCVSSIFHVPLADACTDSVLTCFAPVASEEIERILKPGGIFVLVTPGPDHLFEFKSVLYDTPYRNPMKDIDTALTLTDDRMIREAFTADKAVLSDLFTMTPYVWHTPQENKKRLDSLETLSVTAEFRIRIYRKETAAA